MVAHRSRADSQPRSLDTTLKELMHLVHALPPHRYDALATHLKQHMTKTISDALRLAISRQPVSVYQISQATGIHPSVLSRFLAGERTLRLDTADRLAQYLNARLITPDEDATR